MDRVRFGRALGYGARHAAKSLLAAAEAAAAPDPRATTTRSSVPAAEPPPAAKAHTAVTAQRNIRASTKHAGALGRSVWSPLAQFTSVVWLQVTGTFFAVVAVFVGSGAWKLRNAPRIDAHSPDAHHFYLYAVIFALFAYFALSSFLRASRRSRR